MISVCGLSLTTLVLNFFNSEEMFLLKLFYERSLPHVQLPNCEGDHQPDYEDER